jgi:hypothetical protein
MLIRAARVFLRSFTQGPARLPLVLSAEALARRLRPQGGQKCGVGLNDGRSATDIQNTD